MGGRRPASTYTGTTTTTKGGGTDGWEAWMRAKTGQAETPQAQRARYLGELQGRIAGGKGGRMMGGLLGLSPAEWAQVGGQGTVPTPRRG